MQLQQIFEQTKQAARQTALLPAGTVNNILTATAEAINRERDFLLSENAKDLATADEQSPLYDRLKLTRERLEGIADGLKSLVRLPSPLNRTLSSQTRPNGLKVERVSVPFGVVGIVYEARPNVTLDVSALCLKSGNACLLKGSRSADFSNRAIVRILHDVLKSFGVNENCVTLMPPTHEAVTEMLRANRYVDVVIPRGGATLIKYVRENAAVPVIETGAGTCHAYFDAYGDTKKGAAIINNAKTRRVSVCNALDCLIIHEKRLHELPLLCAPLTKSNVLIEADERAFAALEVKYPAKLLAPTNDNSFGHEYLDYAMAVKTVNSLDEALEHIANYGSGHSECIITENRRNGELFLRSVDAACVYENAPTSFSDGMQLGLGAEIGISTQKLHARGPMGLEELTTYKWIIRGSGQTRP